MLKLTDLEESALAFSEGYKTTRNAFNKYEFVNFEDKDIGFDLGFGAYAFFHLIKAFKYRKIMKERLESF